MTDCERISRITNLIAQQREGDPNGGLGAWVSLTRKYVCMPIPKIACTTAKAVLLHLEGAGLPEEEVWRVHEPTRGTHLSDLALSQAVEALASPDWFRFAFVRNPYDRILSAYKSKLGNPNDTQYEWLRAEVRATFGYPDREGLPPTVAFRDFVRYLSGRPEHAWHDGHFNAQTDILAEHLITYDFIGRFESFQADFGKVLTRMGADQEAIDMKKVVRNPSNWTPAPWAYDPELAETVCELYRSDFERFGYAAESWMYPFG
ncbi:MAG: sulfotransferase family protein [Verrucomicrobia bacterium]|jgi:hypothetical protein|nr:sulfotransferase family protein [Verrucomicrobiota bacterium]